MNKTIKTITCFLFLISSLVLAGRAPFTVVESKTIEELEREIEEKRKEKEQKEAELKDIEAEINSLQSESSSISGQISYVEDELDATRREIEARIAKVGLIEEEIVLIEEYINQQREVLGESALQLYEMQQLSGVEMFFQSDDISDMMIESSLREAAIEENKNEIDNLVSRMDEVNQEKQAVQEEKARFETDMAELNAREDELEAKLGEVESSIEESASTAEGLRGQIGQLQTGIDLLEEEQKQIIEEEQRKMRESSGSGGVTHNLTPGEYYFRGIGRDLYDGHGVGMSQMGAYGMGRAGWSYERILKFYYSGVSIKEAGRTTIPVSGYGEMDIDEYVAGLGEVADRACGTQAQVDKNPEKYALDNPDTIWDCWPEETIKAQVVAARTYALYYTRGGRAICTSASCQVYKGGTAKAWAANETSKQYLYHDYEGDAIGAFYHASARGHTEGNQYVWTANKSGDIGSGKPYLKGVDDSSVSYKNSYYNWKWTTESYSLREMSDIFAQWEATDVGTLESMTITRGDSTRAWQVTLSGSKGSKTVAGWYLKSLWNGWIYDAKASDQRDYIYSTDFYFMKAE